MEVTPATSPITARRKRGAERRPAIPDDLAVGDDDSLGPGVDQGAHFGPGRRPAAEVEANFDRRMSPTPRPSAQSLAIERSHHGQCRSRKALLNGCDKSAMIAVRDWRWKKINSSRKRELGEIIAFDLPDPRAWAIIRAPEKCRSGKRDDGRVCTPQLRIGEFAVPVAKEQVVELVGTDQVAHRAERAHLPLDLGRKRNRRPQPQTAVFKPHDNHPRWIIEAEKRDDLAVRYPQAGCQPIKPDDLLVPLAGTLSCSSYSPGRARARLLRGIGGDGLHLFLLRLARFLALFHLSLGHHRSPAAAPSCAGPRS